MQTVLDCGPATAAAVDDWIAVGTRSGLVLVFDVTQTLRWYLETADVAAAGDEPRQSR